MSSSVIRNSRFMAVLWVCIGSLSGLALGINLASGIGALQILNLACIVLAVYFVYRNFSDVYRLAKLDGK